jgi:hypothetical protein
VLIGLLKRWVSVQYGYWYARSVEFLDLQGTRGRA